MEYITAGGVEYAAKAVTTSTNSISFVLEGQKIGDIETAFRGVTDLTVSGDDKTVYGTYSNLSFDSAKVSEDGSITVVMHIPSKEELRIAALEEAVAEHDEAIAEIYGGESK